MRARRVNRSASHRPRHRASDLDQGAYNRRRVTFLHLYPIRGEKVYKNLLVATDGSKLSDKAVAHAIALARSVGATITAFYAAHEYPLTDYADGVGHEPV